MSGQPGGAASAVAAKPALAVVERGDAAGGAVGQTNHRMALAALRARDDAPRRGPFLLPAAVQFGDCTHTTASWSVL
jgi:hypothetical protein